MSGTDIYGLCDTKIGLHTAFEPDRGNVAVRDGVYLDPYIGIDAARSRRPMPDVGCVEIS